MNLRVANFQRKIGQSLAVTTVDESESIRYGLAFGEEDLTIVGENARITAPEKREADAPLGGKGGYCRTRSGH